MAETNIVESSIDRVQEAFRNVEDGFDKFQKDLAKRRKRVEKDAQKRVKQLRTDLRKNKLVKRVETLQKDTVKQIETLQKDTAKQIESGVETLLSTLQIASQSDLKKIDRKLGQLSRKLREIEKAQGEA